MNKLEGLKQSARASAAFRGHKLSRFAMYGGHRKDLYTAHCTRCGRGGYINLHPLPNEIDIGGEVVALECKTYTERKDLQND